LPLKARRLGVPLGRPDRTPLWAVLLMYEHRASGERRPRRPRRYAPRPAMCGEAIDVPEMVF
jgi:hypothetical protein